MSPIDKKKNRGKLTNPPSSSVKPGSRPKSPPAPKSKKPPPVPSGIPKPSSPVSKLTKPLKSLLSRTPLSPASRSKKDQKKEGKRGDREQPPIPTKDESKNSARAFIETCEAELEVTKDKVRASRLNFEIAQAYETQLFDSKKALKHYQDSLEKTPDYLPSLRSAKRLLLKVRNYNLALELLDKEIKVPRVIFANN